MTENHYFLMKTQIEKIVQFIVEFYNVSYALCCVQMKLVIINLFEQM